MTTLTDAYDSMDYEEIEMHEGFVIPASTPAVFNYRGSRPTLTTDEIEQRLKGDDYAFIDVYGEDKDEKVYLRAKVYDGPSNTSFTVKIHTHAVCIFPDPEIPFSAFKRFVSHLEDSLAVELTPRDNTTD